MMTDLLDEERGDHAYVSTLLMTMKPTTMNYQMSVVTAVSA